jgi:oxygen-independent coproporphyrinogen-3 oxidase
VIYIHIPFCRSFCTYCDFYSEVAAKCRRAEDETRQQEQFNAFAEALKKEMAYRAGELSDEVNTIYIGGGTPSVLPLSVYSSLVQELREAGIKAPFDEFTFEVNPEDVVDKGPAYIEGLMELGVNRISMGVQSFDDSVLKFMNRRHDAETARKAYSILEQAGVGNISLDLIFGLPQLSDDQWNHTLDQALSISSDGRQPCHISSYQLSVEPGSALARLVERGKWEEATEEACARQYDILCSRLKAAGYHHYEISNFALPGYEARHNSAYWAHVPYVGLGPGAHSFITPAVQAQGGKEYIRRWNRPDLQAYIADPLSVSEQEVLDDEQIVMEKVMLALRTSAGMSEAFIRKRCDAAAVDRAILAVDLVPAGPGMLRIPEDKFFVSDRIVAEII